MRIVDEFEKAFAAGFVTGIKLLMMLSVYLGLFNLFPLPALDGGRLVFLGYEMVTRRRANPKIEAMVHMGGIMVLGVVMILVTLRDFHVFSVPHATGRAKVGACSPPTSSIGSRPSRACTCSRTRAAR